MALLLTTGCAPLHFPHATFHPSRQTRHHAGGASAGLLVNLQETNNPNNAVGFYGEGWGRLSLGPGQLEVRLNPALGFVGYRFPILNDDEIPVRLSLQGSLGLGFYHVETNTTRGAVYTNKATTFTAIATIAPILSLFDETFYIIPRFGGGGVENPLNLRITPGTGVVAGGISVGYIIPLDGFDLSLELGWQRVSYTDHWVGGGLGDYEILAFTVGLNLFKETGSSATTGRTSEGSSSDEDADEAEDEIDQATPELAPLPEKRKRKKSNP